MNKRTRLQGFITVTEAAEILGIVPMTLRRWEKAGKVKVRRHPINGYRIFKEEDILKLKRLIEGGV